ncbi:MAG: HAMP domain-containing histidine kinase [Flavobacteriales bacterium]|nr:HAMP domain-containing histidine kinase [Flavobacteriales bacterium]
MNIYTRKQQWKLLLLITAVCIGLSSLWYTNSLIGKLADQERKKVELWAQGTRKIADTSDDAGDISILFDVIQNNETVPVILTDEEGNVNSWRNLDSVRAQDPAYLKHMIEVMKEEHPPIEVDLIKGKNYVYYRNSTILMQLKYYPLVQLAVISLFIVVSYFAFSSSRKAEQNQVWIGMAKETAHQLGTPLSSLVAWLELLKLKGVDDSTTAELQKDVSRLETITERFSKIGAIPKLDRTNLMEVLRNTMTYMQSRSPRKVSFDIHSKEEAVHAPINAPLFEWVVENLIRNAVDAMSGEGKLNITVTDQLQYVYIDVSDTGKGIPKSQYKSVFQPGFTTKKTGWGLGLSLSKRIIENYHKGKIFVKQSDSGKGSTFRIVLKK